MKGDFSSSNFNVMLENLVVKPESDSADFNHIASVEGVFLANVYRAEQVDYVAKMTKSNKSSSNVKSVKSITDFIETKISFNLGAGWHYISAPAIDSLQKPIKCGSEEKCRLHLNLHTNSVCPPVYSSENAPGIIIATGNVGEYLSQNHYDYNTYMSQDGGVSWIEIAKGVNIYEIGDQGGLIVLARYKTETKMVRFSYDMGKSWSYVNFNESNVYVSNIVIEPTNNNHHFLMTGFEFDVSNNVKKGVAFHLDFSEYHLRECKGYNTPEEGDSDYEKFTPHSFRNSSCLLGKSVYYIRKKADKRCINPDHYQFYYINNYCKCTSEDYECDIGFKRTSEGTCISKDGKEIDLSPPVILFNKIGTKEVY